MKALLAHTLGEPSEVLSLEDVPIPTAGPDQVVVHVRASAANFPDALMCRGEYQVRPDLPFSPGLEVCGEVVELGSDVSGVQVGDRVLGGTVLPHGGFAEYALMDAEQVFAAPDSLDDAEASALYIGYQTAWFALNRRTTLLPGETLLVHAGAGGVGSAAVQLGRAAGAQVIAVVGNSDKAEVARQLGAHVVVDRSEDDFVEVVKEATGGRGADVVFDPVGGETYRRSTKCVAFEGRIVVVGFAGGEIQEVALNHALIKNYSVLGLHWGFYLHKMPGLVPHCHAELARMADEGLVKPLVSERFELAKGAEAVQRLADGHTVGRVVVLA